MPDATRTWPAALEVLELEIRCYVSLTNATEEVEALAVCAPPVLGARVEEAPNSELVLFGSSRRRTRTLCKTARSLSIATGFTR